MSVLLDLLTLTPLAADHWRGAASGPPGKRSFGGLFAAQSLAAACATVDGDKRPTNLHVQFLRGGEAGEATDEFAAGSWPVGGQVRDRNSQLARRIA